MLDISPAGVFLAVSALLAALLWLFLGKRARAPWSPVKLGTGTPPFAAYGVVSSQYAYWCSLAISVLSIRYIPPGSIRTAVMLTPVLTALYCVSMAYWLYRACDEYIRLRLLRCAAATAIVVAFCTLAYFFLELLGYPRLSMLCEPPRVERL
jgi:hypothetical protein